MITQFKNLIYALSAFMEDLWLPNEDCIGSLKTAIYGGMISKEELKEEYSEAFVDTKFDWHRVAKESQLLIEPEAYTDIEISNYVKCLLNDFLFPENALDSNKIELLSMAVVEALKNHRSNDGWMFSYDLYNELREDEAYEDLDYYNLWKIDFNNYNIKIKSIENKDREIGYLRFSTKTV